MLSDECGVSGAKVERRVGAKRALVGGGQALEKVGVAIEGDSAGFGKKGSVVWGGAVENLLKTSKNQSLKMSGWGIVVDRRCRWK